MEHSSPDMTLAIIGKEVVDGPDMPPLVLSPEDVEDSDSASEYSNDSGELHEETWSSSEQDSSSQPVTPQLCESPYRLETPPPCQSPEPPKPKRVPRPKSVPAPPSAARRLDLPPVGLAVTLLRKPTVRFPPHQSLHRSYSAEKILTDRSVHPSAPNLKRMRSVAALISNRTSSQEPDKKVQASTLRIRMSVEAISFHDDGSIVPPHEHSRLVQREGRAFEPQGSSPEREQHWEGLLKVLRGLSG